MPEIMIWAKSADAARSANDIGGVVEAVVADLVDEISLDPFHQLDRGGAAAIGELSAA
jgi:hypothetical protein